MAGYIIHESRIDWPVVKTTLLLYAAVFAIYVIFHFLRAGWKVYQEQEQVLLKTRAQLSEEDLRKAQIEAIREQTLAQKAHTAEMIRQFDEQARESNPITKAFRAVQEKQARTQLGLEPESAEYHRRVWLDALTREYVSSHNNIPPAIVAGTEPPPTEWLNKRIQQLNEAFQKQGKSFRLTLIGDEARPAEHKLKDKVLELANDLFAFLREKGPQPQPKIDKSLDWDVRVEQMGEATGPYVKAIAFGYEHRFNQRVVDLFNELNEHSVEIPTIPDLQDWELDPPYGQNAERIKRIAEILFLVAAKMEVDEAAKGI